jgi:hypothetical protein
VLLGIYAVNLLLALASAVLGTAGSGAVLDYSLHSGRLYHGFDLAVFMEFLSRTEISPAPYALASFFSAARFFLLLLFLSGGVLETYRRPRPLSGVQFLSSSAGFFWRMVRLLLFFLTILVVPAIAGVGGLGAAGKLSSGRLPDWLVAAILLAGAIAGWLVFAAARLWLDMAQVRLVAENERAARRALAASFRLVRGGFLSLIWLYLRISLVAWAVLALAAWTWLHWVRPESVGISFLLGQAVLLAWWLTRLWQRAAETLWYQRHVTPSAPSAVSDFSI